MLVYGPSAGGALRALADQLGAQTLNDLPKPVHLGWGKFSLHTLETAAVLGTVVIFDLTHMEDVADVLADTGHHARTITGVELRYIRDNWDRFAAVVQFYENGELRVAPWQKP